MTGETKKGILLNLKAFREVHRDLDGTLAALTAEARVNPVEAAIESLIAEGKALIG
jgi:hypothetical protein